MKKSSSHGGREVADGAETPLGAKQPSLSSPWLKYQQPQADEGETAKQWPLPCGRRRRIHAELLVGGCYCQTIPSSVFNIARASRWTFLSKEPLLHTFLAWVIPVGVGLLWPGRLSGWGIESLTLQGLHLALRQLVC